MVRGSQHDPAAPTGSVCCRRLSQLLEFAQVVVGEYLTPRADPLGITGQRLGVMTGYCLISSRR